MFFLQIAATKNDMDTIDTQNDFKMTAREEVPPIKYGLWVVLIHGKS